MERRLPKDILNLVAQYKQYAEMNSEILLYLYNTLIKPARNNYKEAIQFRDEMNLIFEDHNSNVRIEIPNLPENNPEDEDGQLSADHDRYPIIVGKISVRSPF